MIIDRLSTSSVSTPLVGLFLLLLTLAIHGQSLGSWWTYDDPQLLIQASSESIDDMFFNPERWQIYSASNFTPLAPLSLSLDLAVGGLKPALFYAHHLLSLALAAWLLFIYARPFTGTMGGIVASAMALLLPVTAHAAHMLMLRHYVEGLSLALLALLSWRRREQSEMYSVLVAFLYLSAMLAKEIYAPLPLLMIAHSVLHQESYRSIARGLVAPSIAAAIYIPWRFTMLASAGGYGDFSFIEAITRLIPTVLGAVVGSVPLWSKFIIGLLAIALLVPLSKGLHRSHILIALLVGLYLAIPVLPVVSHFESRHAFAVTIALAFFVGLAASRARNRGHLAIVSLLVLSASIAGRLEDRVINLREDIMITEGRYVWEADPSDGVLFGTSGVWYLDGLSYLRQTELGEEAPAYYLSTLGFVIEGVPADRVVSAINWPSPSDIDHLRARLELGSLPATLTTEGRTLSWSIPEDGASWYLLSPAGHELFTLEPPNGMVMLPFELWSPSLELTRPMSFRLARRAKDGSTIVTPPLDP